MKYTTGEIVRINDIVRIHDTNTIGDKTLAIVNKLYNNVLSCTSIVNGLPLMLNIDKCELCYRNDKDSILYWRRITDTNIENFVNKYRDIKYIRDNWFSDPLIKNNITAETILNRAKYPTINDKQARDILLYNENILDIIIAYKDYNFCKKYCKAFVDVYINDEMFYKLFNAIWNC